MLPIPLKCLLGSPGALLANWSTNGRDRSARRGGPLMDSDIDELYKIMTENNSKFKNENIDMEVKNEQQLKQKNYQGTFIVLYFIVIFCNTVKIKLKQTKYLLSNLR